jgi:hypothetical protein
MGARSAGTSIVLSTRRAAVRSGALVGILLLSVVILAAALVWRLGSKAPVAAGAAAPVVTAPTVHSIPSVDPVSALPAPTQALSPALWPVVDRELPADLRLRPLVDGNLALLDQPQDLLAVRRLLRDVREGDTLRNEAANLLNRSGIAADLAEDLRAVLAHPAEQERFRSFAAQHLGVLWNQAGSASSALRNELRSYLSDAHVAVQREAILALSRGQDAVVLGWVQAVLDDPSRAGVLDLACRIAAEQGFVTLLPRIQTLVASSDPVVQRAARHAVATLMAAVSGSASSVAVVSQLPTVPGMTP